MIDIMVLVPLTPYPSVIQTGEQANPLRRREFGCLRADVTDGILTITCTSFRTPPACRSTRSPPSPNATLLDIRLALISSTHWLGAPSKAYNLSVRPQAHQQILCYMLGDLKGMPGVLICSGHRGGATLLTRHGKMRPILPRLTATQLDHQPTGPFNFLPSASCRCVVLHLRTPPATFLSFLSFVFSFLNGTLS